MAGLSFSRTKCLRGFRPPSLGPGWAGMAQVLGQFSDNGLSTPFCRVPRMSVLACSRSFAPLSLILWAPLICLGLVLAPIQLLDDSVPELAKNSAGALLK